MTVLDIGLMRLQGSFARADEYFTLNAPNVFVNEFVTCVSDFLSEAHLLGGSGVH